MTVTVAAPSRARSPDGGPVPLAVPHPTRTARPRHDLVCPPDHFDVAYALGCNVVSDGRHVLVDERAEGLARDLATAGFEPILLAVDEFTKAGGGIKCMTMEVHGRPPGPATTSTTPVTTTRKARR